MEDKLFVQSEALSSNIVLFCRELKARNIEGTTLNQLRRAATSVYANVNEAHGAQGRKDFAAFNTYR